ncbi:hypothetical protein [uncultured Bacteroides sp.]|uniref:hypothetical protein n=1 Tax=uncultured Bacteroides sp. TaxID=162156 RepID=UPI0026124901|nr:hypothetical protein [uncultured Bacteroides sp.]
MKPLKPTLSIAELQKTLGLWKSRKITDSVIPKLLRLYLGMTAYMNQEKVYPVENFYEISIALAFKNARFLAEAVKRCGSFGITPEKNIYGMKLFYSPLWVEKISPEELPEKFPETCPMDNIYTKGDSSDEEASPEGDTPLEDNSSKKNIVTPESLAAAKEFFHLINKDSTQKTQILTPLINWFQLHEGLTRKHACENLIYLVNELLIPYFASQARFMKSNHTGRLCWLNNLLKSAHGQHLMNDAARGSREKRAETAQENRINQRNNHPLSEFEWTDPETGMRFYDDDLEGAVNIPEEAQPRPTAEAVWNVLSQEWVSPNS